MGVLEDDIGVAIFLAHVLMVERVRLSLVQNVKTNKARLETVDKVHAAILLAISEQTRVSRIFVHFGDAYAKQVGIVATAIDGVALVRHVKGHRVFWLLAEVLIERVAGCTGLGGGAGCRRRCGRGACRGGTRRSCCRSRRGRRC